MNKDSKIWLKQANRDLLVAKKLLKDEEYYAVAFFCQQAAEKALKSLFIEKNKLILKVHYFVMLANKMNAPLNIVEACSIINPVYVEVRYPESDELPADKVNKHKALELISKTEIILQWIQKKS